MYRISHIIIFVALFLSSCSSCKLKQIPDITQSKVSDFITLLEQFEAFYPGDTLTDLSEKLFFTDPCRTVGIDSSLAYIVAPLPPFFKASPSIKVKCEKGWFVFLVHQYEVANIELKYIDVISYDFNGNMVSRMNLPFVDAHGGLYYELDEKTLGRGEIAISKNFLEYKWYCWRDHDKFIDTLLSKFKIFPNGSMKQVNVEETNKN